MRYTPGLVGTVSGVNLTMPTCREGREVKRMAKLVQQGLTSNLLKGVQGKRKSDWNEKAFNRDVRI